MSYQEFIKPYLNGYEDGEIGNTPVTAAILNTNYDGFLLALNEFLPGLEGMVEANPSESATAGNLTKLKVGNSIYLVPSGGGSGSGTHEYSETEHEVGTWIDGRTIYEKTFVLDNQVEVAADPNRTEMPFTIMDKDLYISAWGMNASGVCYTLIPSHGANGVVYVANMTSNNVWIKNVTIQYVKAS